MTITLFTNKIIYWPVYNFIRKEGNSHNNLRENFEKYFDKNLTPLETDLEAFSNDPII